MSYPSFHNRRVNFQLYKKFSTLKHGETGVTQKNTGPSSDLGNRLKFRKYQEEAFENRSNGIECWVWGRQTGKSYTLAAWAVDRLLTRPGRLVTVLSNSLSNGVELNRKCAQICRSLKHNYEQNGNNAEQCYETMNFETRIRVLDQLSRIRILPANPRTARGFSGDLILDEFAFHEDADAIWEAVEPILASNKDFLCRIASTPNGRHNIFYRLASGGSIPARILPRSEAWRQGLEIYHPITRELITPDEARSLATDRRAYDQNYECKFESENMPLLTHELISAAEQPNCGLICDQDWPPNCLSSLANNRAPLFIGVDVGRSRDLTVITLLEVSSTTELTVRAMLRLSNMRLPDQQMRLEAAASLRGFRGAHIDRTGLGLGLFEYSQAKLGSRVAGLDFAGTVPLDSFLKRNAEAPGRVKVPEALALQLLRAFEDRRLHLPPDPLLREDLRKPERIIAPGGEVRIFATSDETGHADHFWSLALAVDAAIRIKPVHVEIIPLAKYASIPKRYFV
jgi:phage FluMu gp28-like protein